MKITDISKVKSGHIRQYIKYLRERGKYTVVASEDSKKIEKCFCMYGHFDVFQVEPKYGSKGTVEPDIFCIYNKSPFFIEVQKTVYSQKTMDEKLKRYEKLYDSKIIEKEPWQPKNNKVFPIVLILSEQRFALDDIYSFELFQSVSFSQFLNTLEPKPVEDDSQ